MSCGDNPVLVLADDFTGANDAGVSLAEAGLAVEVAFNAGHQSTPGRWSSIAIVGRFPWRRLQRK